MAVGLVIEPRQLARGEERYVIPPGTAARALAGQSIEDVLPQTVRTVVGRPLVVENQDTTRHTFGPFALDPGQSWRRTFATAGDVQIACSLYPSTGFTISVAPPPVPAVRTTALLAAWLALLTIAVAVAVGGVGVAAGRGLDHEAQQPELGAMSPSLVDATPNSPDGSMTHLTVDSMPPSPVGVMPRATVRAWRVARTSLALLPPFTATVVTLAALRLSRTAAWTDVATSRTTWLWALTVGLALAAAWCGQRLANGMYALFGTGLALATLALAWTPFLGIGGALNTVMATAGTGLLLAALIARLSGVGGSNAARRLSWAVAVPGAVLLAVALPTGAATPPAQALLAAPKLAAALGLAWLARAFVRRGDGTTAPVLTVGSALAALWSFGQLYGALLGHLNAVTLPKYGNPVPPSTASTTRGAALWAAECAACHDPTDAAALAVLPDRTLFEAITFGRSVTQRSTTSTSPGRSPTGAMPAFKYRLDVFQRGDIVNFVRTTDVGESSDP